MKNLIKNVVYMAILSVAFVSLSVNADIYQQDFDSWTGAPQSSFTASTDSSGWNGNAVKVYGGYGRTLTPYSTPYLAAMQSDGAYMQSPLLTNGIGQISFRYGIDGNTFFDFDVQISGDGSNWTTIDNIQTTITEQKTWSEYTKTLDHYSNLYFRVKCKVTDYNRFLGIDSINITKPNPNVIVKDTTVVPDNIYGGTEATVVTSIEKFGNVQNFDAKAYWKKIGGTWASINMTNTTGNAYVASESIPGQIAGIKVEYYVKVEFTGVNSPKYSPVDGATSPYSYTVQAEAFKSKFASMNVDIQPVTQPPGTPQSVIMYLDGDDFRQGVSLRDGYVGGINFDVEATTTNSIVENYGVLTSNLFDLPLNTELTLDGNQLMTTNRLIQQLLFRVWENDMSITVEECIYMDFTTWPTTTGYNDSTFTFATKAWSAYNTHITTDNERKFRGKAAYLNSTGATSYVRSPAVTPSQGFGELTFWYRNFTDSGAAASFAVQVSETGGTSDTEWITVTNVTDIYSVEYLKFNLLMNDRASKYLRIRNTGNVNLCLDDILIGYAAAGVVLDNITVSPTSPNVLDEVYVYADVTPLKGAQSIVSKLYYRFGTNGNYMQIAMIPRSGKTYDPVSPFPAGCNGTLQYYFEVTFEGSRGQEKAYYPSGAGENPYELFYTDIFSEQDFDAWPGTPQRGFQNSSDTTGWSALNAQVARGLGEVLPPNSLPFCAQLAYDGYIQTPLFVNGVGVLNFMYALSDEGNVQIEIQSSIDGIEWETKDVVSVSLPKETWLSYSKALLINDPVYLRIKMTRPTSGITVFVDDVLVTLPATTVSIGTEKRTPAYASYNEPVEINCLLSSATPVLPANDINGKIFYRKKGSGSAFSSVDMANKGFGNFSGTIPAGVVESGDVIEYYIQSSFKGYAYKDSLNFSPTYSPEGTIAQGSSYFAPPTQYLEYDTRRFVSNVGTMVVNMTNSLGGVVAPVTMSLYDDDVWQGIISMGSFEELFLDIIATNIKTNSASVPFNKTFGDGAQSATIPPISATAKIDDPSIKINGMTNQQYVVRLYMNTYEYVLMACEAQNFDDWFLDSDFYALGQNSKGGSSQWTVDFESWPTNNQKKLNVNFNDLLWVEPLSGQQHWLYPENAGWQVNYWAQYEYQIWNSKLFNNPTNNSVVAQIQPSKQQGFMFPHGINPIHDYGVGSVSFKYKVVDDNVYSVIADMTSTNTFISEVNYGVSAQIKGYGSNIDDGNYHAIRLRQVDENNYIEGRVVQIRGNRFYLEIWLCQAGVLTFKERATGGSDSGGYKGYLGSLEEGGELIGKIKDGTSNEVTVTLSFKSSKTSAVVSLSNKVIVAPALYGQAAPYGFAASGANMIVSSYDVKNYDRNDLSWWAESFNRNDFSVMQFNDNWVHAITTNEFSQIIGRMQRMGVGSFATAPSTGLAVSLDPGDNTGTVADNQASWIRYGYERGLANLYYKEMVVNVNTADHAFAIINRSNQGSDNYLSTRIYDIKVTGWVGDLLTRDSWVNNYGWIQYEKKIVNGVVGINKYVELRRSKTPVTKRQYIASPKYSTIGSFGFEYMIPAESALPIVKVWKATNIANPATWELITDSAIDPAKPRDEWHFFSKSVVDENEGFLIVENASTAASDAIVKLDNITIYPSGEGSDNSWAAYNARLTGDEKTFAGRQSAFLNLNSTLNTLNGTAYTNSNPYIRTPKLNNGIGEISFWYGMLDNPAATLDHAILKLEVSETGGSNDWNKLAEFNVNSQNYQFFTTNVFDTVSKYLRFSNVTKTNGVPKRLAIDNLLVIDPYATTLDVKTVRTVPEQPLSTDVVKVQAELTNYKFGPFDVQPVTYYYYSTNVWAKWAKENASGTLPMELISVSTNVSPTVYTYQTTGGIPTQNPNTCVQYYVSVEYDGEVFADKTSPRIFRQALTNPSWYEPINYYTTYGTTKYNNPYYIVYSCPPGAVWFNEVNVEDGVFDEWEWELETGTNSYVELAGKAGIDISGWSLEMYNTQNQKVKTYTIGASTTLANDKNGYGFFVFGAPLVQNKNLTLTDDFGDLWDGPNYIKTPGGLILRRDFGSVEYKVCFNSQTLTAHGFHYIGDDLAVDGDYIPQSKSLQLTGGPGSNYYNFAWNLIDGFTPGTVNTGQIISGGESNEFTLIIANYWFDGTNVYIVSEGTGAWSAPEVWFSTNLVETTPYWEKLTGVTSDVSGNVATQYFAVPTSPPSPTIYYKIQGQN